MVPDPGSFTPLPGLGVKAMAGDGRTIFVGRLSALADQGIVASRNVEDIVAGQASLGRNVIAMAGDKEIAGVFAFEDEIRAGAGDTIKRLDRMGLRTILLTGDNRNAAERVSGQLGIREVYAEFMPRDKEGLVKRLQSEGRTVAFVGDGVNDGPALAVADVGIAMGDNGHGRGHRDGGGGLIIGRPGPAAPPVHHIPEGHQDH